MLKYTFRDTGCQTQHLKVSSRWKKRCIAVYIITFLDVPVAKKLKIFLNLDIFKKLFKVSGDWKHENHHDIILKTF